MQVGLAWNHLMISAQTIVAAPFYRGSTPPSVQPNIGGFIFSPLKSTCTYFFVVV